MTEKSANDSSHGNISDVSVQKIVTFFKKESPRDGG
jgi:hypothetical protein